jgi:accessory gene regulator B
LAVTLGHNHTKRHIYYYSLQGLFGSLIKLALLALITNILGTFSSTLIVLGFYAMIRVPAGGYHASTFMGCTAISLPIFILSGVIAKYVSFSVPIFAIILIFLMCLFAVIKYAPADTIYKPITNPILIKKLKRASIIMASVWFISALIMAKYGLNTLLLSGCIGILIGTFIITPVGYKLNDLIDSAFKR